MHHVELSLSNDALVKSKIGVVSKERQLYKSPSFLQGSSTAITLEACKEALPALTGLMRLRLPCEVQHGWPAAEVSQTFPLLKSYLAAPPRQTRQPGIIEDNLQRWAIQQPELLATGRLQILNWFHDTRC